MDIEASFSQLHQTFQSLLKSALARRFFFTFLNIHYETTLFKAQQTSGKLKPEEKKTEEVKIDPKVEEALEAAKKVWTGAKPVEPKKGLKKPTEAKKPEPRRPEPKKPEPKKTGPAVVLQDINPLEVYSVTSIMVNPEFMEKYQDLKGRFSSSLGHGLGGMSQGRKAEATARKSFLTKLNKKFQSKNIKTEIDSQAVQCYAAFKVLSEIDLIVNDDDLVRSFFDLASKSIQSFTKEDRVKLYKASFTLNVIDKSLQEIRNFEGVKGLSFRFSQLAESGKQGAEVIEKMDSFVVEKNVLAELSKACTRDEVKEAIDKYQKLDKWRLGNEVYKFITGNIQSTKSLPGLRVLHSLACKKGRSFCTFTNI